MVSSFNSTRIKLAKFLLPLAANQNSNSCLAGSDIDSFSEFLLEEAIVISKGFFKDSCFEKQ